MCLKIACFGLHNEDDSDTGYGHHHQPWQQHHYGGHGQQQRSYYGAGSGHGQHHGQGYAHYYGNGDQAGARVDGYGGGGGFTTAVAQPTATYYRYPAAPDGTVKPPATNYNYGARYPELGRY